MSKRREPPLFMLVKQLLSRFKRLLFNRQSAFLVASLLYMLRTTLFNLIVKGKWVNDITTYFERKKQLQKFTSSDHSNVVQAALYSVSGDRVNKRTLFEQHIVNLLYENKAAGTQMVQATKLCSKDLPFVTQHLNQTHSFLNTVLNKLSSLTASDHIEYDALVDKKSEEWKPVWYVFGVLGYSPSLGFSNASDINTEGNTKEEGTRARMSSVASLTPSMCDRRSTKLRVVVVREDVLLNLDVNEYVNTTMISERHTFRMDSLIRMKAMYARQQDFNITSVVDKMCGSISTRHLMRVQMGYTKTKKKETTEKVNIYAERLQSPSAHFLSQIPNQEDQDSPAMFSPRRN